MLQELFTLPRWNDTSLAEITLPQIRYEDLKIVVQVSHVQLYLYILCTCFIKLINFNCQYMYRGEITVPRHQLPSLLEVASTLKIPGIYTEMLICYSNLNYSNEITSQFQLSFANFRRSCPIMNNQMILSMLYSSRQVVSFLN